MKHSSLSGIADTGAGDVENTSADSGPLRFFDRQFFVLIQETVAKVTGLGMAVLDADGKTIMEFPASSPVCRRRRRDTHLVGMCRSSDAYGVHQASACHGSFVYFCPCGLVRAVIPILADGVCLGGVYLGHVRCDNAPVHTPRLDRLLASEGDRQSTDRAFSEMYESTPTYDFSYFTYITETLAAVIDRVATGASERLCRLEGMEADRALSDERIRRLERELHIRESSLAHVKSRLNLNFFINILNSVASLAVIEDAPRTNEMCVLFAEHLRQYLAVERNFASLREEVGGVERYLAIQKIRFGDLLRYTLDLPEDIALYRAPTQVFLPFVESAVLYGLATREEEYVLSFSVSLEQNTVTVRIADNSDGFSGGAVLPAQSGFDANAAATGLAVARDRLETLFGRQHEVSFFHTATSSGCVLRYSLPQREGGD